MATGLPDWSIAGYSTLDVPNFDNNELAARLGSEYVLNRAGRVLFRDLFTREDTLYTQTSLGLTTPPAVSTLGSIYGNSSLLTVIGAGAANFIKFTRKIRTRYLARLSLEVGVWMNAAPSNFALNIRQYGIGNNNEAEIRYQANATEIERLDNAGVYVSVDSLTNAYLGLNMFSSLRLEIASPVGWYKTFRANDRLYEFNNPEMNNAFISGPLHMEFSIQCNGRAAGALNFVLDYVLVTEDEAL
jgi:hypothetical protein